MKGATASSKWIDGLFADTPCIIAARRVLSRRLRSVGRLLPLAAQRAGEDVEYVHQLRVATRRAAAALRAFHAICGEKELQRASRFLRRARRAASEARADDVHLEMLRHDPQAGSEEAREACERVIAAIGEHRRRAQKRIRQVHKRYPLGKVQSLRRGLLASAHVSWTTDEASGANGNGAAGVHRPYTLGDLAARELPPLVEVIVAARKREITNLDELHALRLAGKRLRYAMELFVGCFPPDFRNELYPQVERMQEHLGGINDCHEIAQRIIQLAREQAAPGNGSADAPAVNSAALVAVANFYDSQREAKYRAFFEWWISDEAREAFDQLAAWVHTHRLSHGLSDIVSSADESSAEGGENLSPTAVAAARGNGQWHRRVAALDIGTNSVRLVVAETDPATTFHVIEDIKETTRLGTGLYTSGRLQEEAMQKTLAALQKMKATTARHRVDRLRAVGTSAVREADNAGQFLQMARDQAGVDIEVIDAEKEARLAFSSAVNTFGLDDRRSAIVDIGGGSTEFVLSAGGVIDSIHPLALGAVRLSEIYASAEAKSGYDYAAMCAAVDQVITERLGRLPYRPEQIIGMGGTFTSLARVAIRRGLGTDGTAHFPFAVRGHELTRGQVASLLDWLRRMPLSERRETPGLSSRRAEIIVAGVCIISRLMENLRIDLLRIHDGGIRDGLLAEMIDELGIDVEAPRRRSGKLIEVARSFAKRCRYEKEHSEHVARLAVQIFDQLAERVHDAGGTWARREHRDLLQAAGLLHDLGTIIEYRRHHKHSYDMIIHGELPVLTRREIEIIANLARYHRRGGPRARHANFKKLGNDDQRLVAHLAGILRIADGLDRLHTQNVTRVFVDVQDDCVRFEAEADENPKVNLKYAKKKADVFQAAFRTKARLSWSPSLAGKGAERSGS